MTIKSKWAYSGFFAGILFLVASVIRYWAMYPDPDRCLVYVIIGLLISAVSFLYGRTIEYGHAIKKLQDELFEFEGYVRDKK